MKQYKPGDFLYVSPKQKKYLVFAFVIIWLACLVMIRRADRLEEGNSQVYNKTNGSYIGTFVGFKDCEIDPAISCVQVKYYSRLIEIPADNAEIRVIK